LPTLTIAHAMSVFEICIMFSSNYAYKIYDTPLYEKNKEKEKIKIKEENKSEFY